MRGSRRIGNEITPLWRPIPKVWSLEAPRAATRTRLTQKAGDLAVGHPKDPERRYANRHPDDLAAQKNGRSKRPAIPFPTSALVVYASLWHAYSMPFCLVCRPFTCQI